MTLIPFDIDQDGWGAQKRFDDGTLSPWRPDKFVIHYGGNANFAGSAELAEARGYDYPSVAAEKAVLRIYEQSHLSRGWSGIAYNYAVGQSGTRYRLRGENRSGATSGDWDDDGIPENHEARAILWIGGKGQIPTPEALASISSIIWADPMLVTVHSQHKATACPGVYLTSWAAREGWKDYQPVTTRYPDVPEDHLFYADIEWLAENDITRVPEGSNFRPDDSISRGEVAAMLHRANEVK